MLAGKTHCPKEICFHRHDRARSRWYRHTQSRASTTCGPKRVLLAQNAICHMFGDRPLSGLYPAVAPISLNRAPNHRFTVYHELNDLVFQPCSSESLQFASNDSTEEQKLGSLASPRCAGSAKSSRVPLSHTHFSHVEKRFFVVTRSRRLPSLTITYAKLHSVDCASFVRRQDTDDSTKEYLLPINSTIDKPRYTCRL